MVGWKVKTLKDYKLRIFPPNLVFRTYPKNNEKKVGQLYINLCTLLRGLVVLLWMDALPVKMEGRAHGGCRVLIVWGEERG